MLDTKNDWPSALCLAWRGSPTLQPHLLARFPASTCPGHRRLGPIRLHDGATPSTGSSGQDLQTFTRRCFPLPFIEAVKHLRAEQHRRRDVQQIEAPRRQRRRVAVAQLARFGVQFHARNRCLNRSMCSSVACRWMATPMTCPRSSLGLVPKLRLGMPCGRSCASHGGGVGGQATVRHHRGANHSQRAKRSFGELAFPSAAWERDPTRPKSGIRMRATARFWNRLLSPQDPVLNGAASVCGAE